MYSSKERIATWHNMYEFRKWPLNVSLQRIFYKFGLDVVYYQTAMSQFAIFYIIMFIMSLGIVIMYFMEDFTNMSSTFFKQNLAVFVYFLPYSSFRGILWICALVTSVLFIRYMTIMRYILQSELKYKCKIEDFSVMLMNIPGHIQDHQVKQMVFNILKQDAIVRYFRIRKPKALNAVIRLQKLEQEYYEYLQGVDPELEIGCRCISYVPFAVKIFQNKGYLRDMRYYKRKLQRLRRKIQKNERKYKNCTDSVIITFQSHQNVKQVYKQLQKLQRPKFEGKKVVCKHVSSPQDVILQNLYYKRWSQALKLFLSYLIVLSISLSFFTLIGFLRYQMRRAKMEEKTLVGQNVKYYGLFVLQMAFDVALRPLLQFSSRIERHYSHSASERYWMTKLFTYTWLNKLSIYYSRQFLDLLGLFSQGGLRASFFAIYGFGRDWRTQLDSGGSDAYFYTATAVFLHPIVDLLGQGLFYAVCCGAARTRTDVARAAKGGRYRYASAYVGLAVLFTFTLCFGHAQPTILIAVPLYFLFNSITSKIVVLKLATPHIHTQIISQQEEGLLYFGCVFGAISLAQSYLTVQRFLVWFLTLVPLFGTFLTFVRIGFFDFIYGKNIKRLIDKADRVRDTARIDLEQCDVYQLPVNNIVPQALAELEQKVLLQQTVNDSKKSGFLSVFKTRNKTNPQNDSVVIATNQLY